MDPYSFSIIAGYMVIVARIEVPSTRSRCSVKAARMTINLDIYSDGVAEDIRGDIAEKDIMLN